MGLVALVGVVFPLFLYHVFIEYNVDSIKILLTILLILFGLSGLAVQTLKRILSDERMGIDFFSPSVFFPLFYSVFYGLGALELTRSEQFIPLSQYSYYFIGITVYFVGLMAFRFLWMEPKKNDGFTKNWSDSRIKIFLAFLISIFLVSMALILTKTKLPIFIGPDVETLRTESVHITGGYIRYIFRTIEIVLILFFVYVFSRKKSLIRSPIKMLLLFVSFFFLSSLAARRAIAVPLLTGVVIYHYTRRKISLGKILSIGLIVFLLLALMGYVRYSGSFQMDKKSIASRIYSELNLYSSLLYETTEHFPSQRQFLGWNGFIQPFRAILPGRQKAVGDILKEDVLKLDFRGGGFMPSILGGFYINFGMLGIVIGMFLCGFISSALYINMQRKKNEFSVVLFAFVSVYFISAVQGMVLGELWPIYVLFVLIMTHIFCKERTYRNKIEDKKNPS